MGIYSAPLHALSNLPLKMPLSHLTGIENVCVKQFIPTLHPYNPLLSESSPPQLVMPPPLLLLRTETEEGVLIHSPIFSSQRSFFQSLSLSNLQGTSNPTAYHTHHTCLHSSLSCLDLLAGPLQWPSHLSPVSNCRP